MSGIVLATWSGIDRALPLPRGVGPVVREMPAPRLERTSGAPTPLLQGLRGAASYRRVQAVDFRAAVLARIDARV